MNRLFAFVWLLIIGTNVAEYYSKTTAYQSAAILAGAAYFLIVFRNELLRLIFFKDYLLVLAILVVPILLMLFSDRSFERGVYTSQMAVALVFVVASVLALRVELNRIGNDSFLLHGSSFSALHRTICWAIRRLFL